MLKGNPTIRLLLVNAQTPKCKSPIEYGNRNQVDPKHSTVRRILGHDISEVGDPAKEIGPIPVCLGLFTEKDHRLIASAVADEEGRFEFGPIPPISLGSARSTQPILP